MLGCGFGVINRIIDTVEISGVNSCLWLQDFYRLHNFRQVLLRVPFSCDCLLSVQNNILYKPKDMKNNHFFLNWSVFSDSYRCVHIIKDPNIVLRLVGKLYQYSKVPSSVKMLCIYWDRPYQIQSHTTSHLLFNQTI